MAQTRDTPAYETAVAVDGFAFVDAESGAVKEAPRNKRPVAKTVYVDAYVAGSPKPVKVPVTELRYVDDPGAEFVGPPALTGKDSPKETIVAAESSHAELQARYLEFHRGIAERLTPEQLAEKCEALEQELNEIIAEHEIERIQKELSELKQKNADNKGISSRLQGAIEALGRSRPVPVRNNPGDTFKSL